MRAAALTILLSAGGAIAAEVTLLSEVTARGEQIDAIAIDYGEPLLSGQHLENQFQVTMTLDGKPWGAREIVRTYSNNEPQTALRPTAGNYLILELNPNDQNAGAYAVRLANQTPQTFRERGENGEILTVERKQATKIPQYYGNRLHYEVKQTGLLATENGSTLTPTVFSGSAEKLNHGILERFSAGKIHGEREDNSLNYRLYRPEKAEKPYLWVFLHGSGQVGSDNLAPLTSSRGALSPLDYEEGYILVPQYDGVFDAFDRESGIHWQTKNRRQLLLKLIEKVLSENPHIDRRRVYLTGLSRGAEGALYLLLDKPQLFAGALMMSGREAHSVEWIDGNATAENLKPIANLPMWFFHSVEDKISPVTGTQKNVAILREQLKNPYLKYTELHFQNQGDNGIINNNAHNTWDMVFNSPTVVQWLLQQRKEMMP